MNAGTSFRGAVRQALANAAVDGQPRHLAGGGADMPDSWFVERTPTPYTVEVRPGEDERDAVRRYLVAKLKLPALRVYVAGPEVGDRYTVAVTDRTWREPRDRRGWVPMLGFNAAPTHPAAGVSQWTEGQLGKHLGEEVEFEALPPELQRHVRARLVDGELDRKGAWWNR